MLTHRNAAGTKQQCLYFDFSAEIWGEQDAKDGRVIASRISEPCWEGVLSYKAGNAR